MYLSWIIILNEKGYWRNTMVEDDYFDGKEILITGGTGSLAKALLKELESHNPKGIRLFSRDELKQWELRQTVSEYKNNISFLVGDIRDEKRIELACKGVDILIHTAALKQVPACEDNPLEAIQTNVIGSRNVFYAALENKVEKVMAISSDKAVYPINLYGATKMCMEKLFIQGNTYSGNRAPHFSCCRYGNVIGSRGSVIPLFKKQAETGVLTITHKDMTRFWIRLGDVAKFILKAVCYMKGGEIFVPRMPSAKVIDIAYGVMRNQTVPLGIIEIGIRPGEKMHETLVTEEEMGSAAINEDMSCFVICGGKFHLGGRSYQSDENLIWLIDKEIDQIVKEEM